MFSASSGAHHFGYLGTGTAPAEKNKSSFDFSALAASSAVKAFVVLLPAAGGQLLFLRGHLAPKHLQVCGDP